jgi:molybdopterin-guanine dinucleotide biosynthesis protein A
MISAIILSGGQSRRFNNQDKGLIIWQGKPLIEHVIDRIQPQVDQIIINSNQNLESYRSLGFTVCEDKLKGHQGPLAGIQASLTSTSHSLVLVCPCDTALLPRNLVSKLNDAIVNQGMDLAYPSCENRHHFLPVLFKAGLAPSLNSYLTGEDRSMKGWYKTLNACAVSFNDESSAFSNFNNPTDLDE